MNILLDQNVPVALSDFLRLLRPSWTILHVRDANLWGASDIEILSWAVPRRFIILTFDEDFADARMFPIGSHAGVIRLRVFPTTIESAQEAITRLLASVEDQQLVESLVIVGKDSIRIRRSIQHG